MANDIRARLRLETKETEKNIANVEKKFSSWLGVNLKLGDSIGNLKNVLGKLSAGLGVAMTAADAWNKTLENNRAIGDEFGRSMSAVNTTIDSFFLSISNGDFSSFFRGLDGTIKRARDLYDAIDALNVFNTFNSANMAEIQRDIAKNRLTIKQNDKSPEEKLQAQENLKRLNKDLVKQAEKHAELANNSFEESLDSVLGAFDDDKGKAKDFLQNYETFQNAQKRQKELEEKATQLAPKSAGMSAGVSGFNVETTIDKYSFLSPEEQEELKKLNAAINYNPKKLEEAFAYRVEALNAERESFMIQAENTESINRDVTQKVATPKVAAKSSAKAKKVEVPVTPVLRLEGFDNELEKMVSADEMWQGDEQSYWSRLNEIGDIDTGKLYELNVQLANTLDELDANKVKKYNDAFQTVGQSVASVSQSLASMLSNDVAGWMLGSIGSVAQMVVQLQALATAQGVSSASKLPFPANLAAIATVVATVASVFNSLPKFAQGGVVGGQDYQDGILARVSSGEMVMTEAQQRKILDLVSSGGSGGDAVSGGSVTRVSGEELVMVINNYGLRSGKGTIKWG